MRTSVLSLLAVCGIASCALAVSNTRVEWQLSSNNTTYANHSALSPLDLIPGSTVYARAVVSYIPGSNGTSVPIGLAAFTFQPTVSNIMPGDQFLPLINGGQGGNGNGVIQPGDNTSFGRFSPWGRAFLTATSHLMGHLNTVNGVNYLRIAQAQATSFIGGVNNTTGGSGVPISQLDDVGRLPADPAFNTSLSNIVVMRFAISLDSSLSSRAVSVVDSPVAGFVGLDFPLGERQVFWYATSTEATGSLRGAPTIIPAYFTIGIPAPAGMAVPTCGVVMLSVARRRRQA